MNMPFEEITKEEYVSTGMSGLINYEFTSTSLRSHKIMENVAKEAINANNKKELKYDAFAAYTFSYTSFNNKIKGVSLLVIQPLKKIS